MELVPAATPVAIPEASMVALAGVPLIHVPPGVVLARDVVAPTHTFNAPVMAAGWKFTVIKYVALQPLLRV
jgi:hypothetical protein